ncbi:MAG: class I SAM-dependent DNA methyltransferase [Solirubrobacterales bacterium]|nr:class I SAM-dependent DNA methyltransferase [Solirubrobacterales bacterium]
MADIRGILKRIRDIMRQDAGISGDAQRIEQMVWIFFMKIFDDREQEIQNLDSGYTSPIPGPLRWRNWAADKEGITGDALLDFVNGELFPKLKEIGLTATGEGSATVIGGVFGDAYNFMKSGTLLRQVINEINAVDFNKSNDRHEFGELYEETLRELQSAGAAGEFYTPRAVTQVIVDLIDPKLGEKVMDPACGTGGFLACAINHVRDNYVKTAEDEKALPGQIIGIEKKPLPHLLCTTNMLLHGIDTPTNVRRDNTLSRPLVDWQPSDKVDVVITNPPFGGTEEPGIENNFPQALRTRETADLFLVLIMQLLKTGGRCGIVFPDGTLFGGDTKTKIKTKLLEECNLHTIVRLPKSVFAPYTSIRTNLLFFDKGEPTKDVWYYEHQLPAGRKAYNKTKPIQISEFDPLKEWWNNREESEQAWKVSIDEIRERDFNLDIENPNTVVEELRDPEELLAEYQEVLAGVADLTGRLTKALGNSLSETAK